ncbi:F0F1 ATP synthase subunit A [Natronospora cellulosivora (SeqCode)]
MDLGPRTLFYLFGNPNLPVTNTLFVSWVVVLMLVFFSNMVTKDLKLIPGRVQNAVELLISSIEDQIEPMIPGEGRNLLPFIATIFIYVGVSNLIGLIPLVPNPTGDVNITVALALIVFVVSHYHGVETSGAWGYIKGFAEPIPFLFPLNIVSELAKPISHSFRLFGNIVGGTVIITLLYMAAPWFIPIPVHLFFDLFIGLVQALIFGMIAISYISIAREYDE